MATDTLATIVSAVRDTLGGNSGTYPDAMVNQAVYSVVADISRLAPRELFSVITLDNIDVEDSELTSSDDTWVYIRNSGDGIAPTVSADTPLPLDRANPPTVKSDGGATTYTENEDYVVDYVQGRIKILSGGAISNGVTLDIDYRKSLLAFTISSLTDLVIIDRIMWMRAGVEQKFDAFHRWGDIVWLVSKDGASQERFVENDQFYIWYHAEHTRPGASAGSYPAFMDDIVVKGAVAYTLFSKHRERVLQSIQDAGLSRASLETADNKQPDIDTAIANADTALTTTAEEIVNALKSTVLQDVQDALDVARGIIQVGGDVDNAINNIGAEYSDLDVALNLMATLMSNSSSDLKTALAAIATEAGEASNAIDNIDPEYAGISNTLGEVATLLDTGSSAIKTAAAAVATEVGLAKGVIDNVNAEYTDLETALDDMAAILLSTSSQLKTALDEIDPELRKGDNYLSIGNDLLNNVNKGVDAGRLFSEYALAKIQAAMAYVREAETRVAQSDARGAEASQRIGKIRVIIEEGQARLSTANQYADEVNTRLNWATNLLNEVTQRLSTITAHVAEGDARNNIALVYVQEANSRLQWIANLAGEANIRVNKLQIRLAEVDARISWANASMLEAQGRVQVSQQYIQAALGYAEQSSSYLSIVESQLAVGNLYLMQSDGFLNTADREVQAADRLLLDARDRHNDYWTHLTSRIESARGGSKTALKQLPQV